MLNLSNQSNNEESKENGSMAVEHFLERLNSLRTKKEYSENVRNIVHKLRSFKDDLIGSIQKCSKVFHIIDGHYKERIKTNMSIICNNDALIK